MTNAIYKQNSIQTTCARVSQRANSGFRNFIAYHTDDRRNNTYLPRIPRTLRW